jgi:hypothetical protein
MALPNPHPSIERPSSPEVCSLRDVQGRRMKRQMGVLAESVRWIHDGSGVKTPSDHPPANIMQILTKCFLRSWKTFLVNEDSWETMRSRLKHSSKDTISTCTSTPQRSQEIAFSMLRYLLFVTITLEVLESNRFISGKSIYWRLTVCGITKYKKVKSKSRG